MPRSVRRRPVGQQWLAGGAAAVALLLFLLGWALWPEGSATESTSRATVPSFSQSIAVLPFETVGAGEATGFTEGIHGDILTRLSNISGLKVISRTSVQQYRDTQKPTTEIGQELGAGWVLEGEVQEVGGQVQVNARLINAQTDQQAWASDYRRKLTAVNLFEIQEEITREISSSLEAQLTPEEKKRVEDAPTQDLEAYRHYVQGRQALDQMTSDEDLRQAGKHFQKALAEDSTFALAWAGLADAIGRNPYQESGSDSLRLPKVSQEEAARRALDLNPDLAEAHAALGYVHFIQHEGPAALRRFRRAVALKPSYAEAQKFLGGLLLPLGMPKEALKHFQLAKELNPQHVLARHGLYDAYLANDRPEMALLGAREQQRMYPEYEQAVWGEIRALYHLDRFEEAARIARQRLADSNTTHEEVALCSYLVAAEAAVGDTAQARSQLDKLESISVPEEGLDRYHALSSIAYAALGNVDAAFGAYQKIEKWPWFAALDLRYLFFPEVRRKLQEDPRYKDLIREINLYWGLKPDGSLPEEN